MKIWFVLYLLGKAAVVVGPLPYGVGHCWAMGKQIIDEINHEPKYEHLAWEYSCIETKRRPRLNQTVDEIEGPPHFPLDRPSKPKHIEHGFLGKAGTLNSGKGGFDTPSVQNK